MGGWDTAADDAGDAGGVGNMVGGSKDGSGGPDAGWRPGTARLDGSGSEAMVYSPELDQPLKDYLVLIGF